jgi:DNA-binding NarL/FixJ family response regulator
VRVVIVDDHAVLRAGLAQLLGAEPDLEVVGTAASGDEGVAVVRELRPDVVLMDLQMAGVDGVSATRQIVAEELADVLVLTSYSDAERIVGALDAGAIGYLLKDAEPEDIVRAVRDSFAGGVPISPGAARALLPGNRPAARSEALTAREREVLTLVAAGLPNKSIARRLAISEKTVKAHLTRVFTVLGVQDRTSAALWAQRHGLV